MPDCKHKVQQIYSYEYKPDFFISWYLVTVLQPLTLKQCSCLPAYFVTILIINLTSLPGIGCEVLPNTPDITTLTLLCRVLTGLEIKYNPGIMWCDINLEGGKLHWHYLLFFLFPNSAVNKIKFLFLILESFWEKSLSEKVLFYFCVVLSVVSSNGLVLCKQSPEFSALVFPLIFKNVVS